MNIQPTNNQPVSDDNDLAKVLSGAEGDAPTPENPVEETPIVETPAEEKSEEQENKSEEPTTSSSNDDLESIKKEALEELKPLVDKLELPPEEKFDILLLIIRSTDDRELVEKAHESAQQIADETRKAQALLDIIKEVDYFSNK